MEPFTLYQPEQQLAPVVIDSPHSGDFFPEGYIPVAVRPILRRWQDRFVNELTAWAPSTGIPLLCANIHRGFVDLNRHVLDVDARILANGEESAANFQPRAYTQKSGNGLFKRFGPNGEQLFEKPLTQAEMNQLIANYYLPYHNQLAELINQTRNRFGKTLHLNMHAMFSTDPQGNERPDFVLSDFNGTTCSPKLVAFIKDVMEEFGYSVAINHPFQGGEIVQQYGKPSHGVHSLQVEIRKALYMNETTFEKHEGFADLQHFLRELFGRVVQWSAQQS